MVFGGGHIVKSRVPGANWPCALLQAGAFMQTLSGGDHLLHDVLLQPCAARCASNERSAERATVWHIKLRPHMANSQN